MADGTLFKVAIAGDGLIGKTCLLNRYTQDQYSDNYKPTIGADFTYKEVEHEGRMIQLQFWDLSGQYRGSKEVTTNFFRGSSGVMICFSLIDNKSLSHVTEWRKRVLDLLPDTPCVLVGTKCDLGSMPEENWSFLCESEKFDGWYQTSAKANIGVQEAFQGLISLMLSHSGPTLKSGNSKVDLKHLKKSSSKEKSSSCSC